MRKIRLEYSRKPCPFNYGDMFPPEEQDIMDFLYEQSELWKNNTYIKHFVNTTWERTEGTYTPECNKELHINMGDLIYHVDVYVQEK